MIERSDILNREYNGKDCVAFEMELKDVDKASQMVTCRARLRAERPSAQARAWDVNVTLDDGASMPALKSFTYVMPSTSIPLDTTAAGILLTLNELLVATAQACQILSSKIFGMTRGM